MKRLALLLLAALAGAGGGLLCLHTPLGRETIARFWESRPRLAAERALQEAARGTRVAPEEIARALELFRAPFTEEEEFQRALEQSHLSLGELRDEATENLRARAWLEEQIAPLLAVSEAEARAFYEQHREQFLEPPRYRVAHLFVAAPEGAPAEVKTGQLNKIIGLSVRLLAGEKFAALGAEASEDEATKASGGDLGFIAQAGVPPEFFAEVEKLKPGETSAPFRSHLGFHLAQLGEMRPARLRTFEEARPEIEAALAREKRSTAVAQLTARLSARK